MLKNYFKLAIIPLLSMAAGVGVCWFMVTWVEHECYFLYLESASNVVIAP